MYTCMYDSIKRQLKYYIKVGLMYSHNSIWVLWKVSIRDVVRRVTDSVFSFEVLINIHSCLLHSNLREHKAARCNLQASSRVEYM